MRQIELQLIASLNPIAGGGPLRPPFRLFLCLGQTPQNIQLILGDFSLLFTAHISEKKLPGQVRSGHQSEFVDLTSEKFAIIVRARVFHGAISSLQVFITVTVCVICISQTLYRYL